MNVIGKDAGNCIHCYEYRGLKMCSLNDLVCDTKDECHCLHYEKRR